MVGDEGHGKPWNTHRPVPVATFDQIRGGDGRWLAGTEGGGILGGRERVDNGQAQTPAWPQYPGYLSRSAVEIVDVLENHARRDHARRSILEGQGGGVTTNDVDTRGVPLRAARARVVERSTATTV